MLDDNTMLDLWYVTRGGPREEQTDRMIEVLEECGYDHSTAASSVKAWADTGTGKAMIEETLENADYHAKKRSEAESHFETGVKETNSQQFVNKHKISSNSQPTPTPAPTQQPTDTPTATPTQQPTAQPTATPTATPTAQTKTDTTKEVIPGYMDASEEITRNADGTMNHYKSYDSDGEVEYEAVFSQDEKNDKYIKVYGANGNIEEYKRTGQNGTYTKEGDSKTYVWDSNSNRMVESGKLTKEETTDNNKTSDSQPTTEEKDGDSKTSGSQTTAGGTGGDSKTSDSQTTSGGTSTSNTVEKKELPTGYGGYKTLARQEADNYYKGTYTDANGNTKDVIIKQDKDGKETVIDYYGTGKELTGGTYEKGELTNGLASVDRKDEYDANAANNYVDRATQDFVSADGKTTIKAGEQIMWDNNVTQTTGAGERGTSSGYAPGQQKDLATSSSFQSVIRSNASENIFRNQEDKKSYSQNEFIAAYAASGQYSAQDLSLTAGALAGTLDGYDTKIVDFAASSSAYFYGTELESLYDDIKDTPWTEKANKYKEDIVTLRENFNSLHDSIEGWSGSASASDKSYLQSIIGKFEETIGNLEDNLIPSCEAMESLVDEIDKLKELEETYISYHGTYDLPNGATSQCKNITFAARSVEVIRKEYEAEKEKNIPPTTITGYRYYDKDGKQVAIPVDGGTTEEVYGATPGYGEWVALVEKLSKELTAAEELDQKNLDALNEQQQVVIIAWYKVKNYETTFKSYSDYFTAGTSQYAWLHGNGTDYDMSSIISSYKDIVTDFEDYSRMPVISDLSKYKVGDVVAFDDAHGFVYAVTGEFDPLTGTIKIACHDKNGNKVGTDVSIWDQREIVPVKVLKENGYDKFYQDFPDAFATDPDTHQIIYATPTVSTTAAPSSGGGGDDTPTPTTEEETLTPTTEEETPTPTIEEETPTPAVVETTVPQVVSTTRPEVVSTTRPGVVSTTGFIEEIPYIGIDTIPSITTTQFTGEGGSTGGGYYGGSGYSGYGGEYSPHTGLDAIYNTGDTKQSATGLGALAGLAAGAAGLGLTGLVGDKKDKDEEENITDEELSQIMEEKPFEEKSDVTSEKNNEQTNNTSNFF